MRISKNNLFISAALSTTLISGCASIVGDSSYPVAVSSTPGGASFEIKDSRGNLVHSGTTPATVSLKSGEGYFDGAEYTIAFKKDGYEAQQITLDSSVSGWYWGNILFGGVIGLFVVDPLTGAMYKLPEEAKVSLGDQVVGTATGKDLTLLTVDQVPEALRDDLIKIN